MKVTIPVCGKFGLIMDQPPQELPLGAWSRAVNMRFRNGSAERIEGERAIFTTPTITPHYIDSFQYGDVRNFVHAGTQKVVVDDGTTRTEITRFTPGAVISSITFVTTTATLTTATPHGRATGDVVTVFDASPSQYNGVFTITVTTTTAFTYTMASTPATNAVLTNASGYSLNVISNFTGAQDDRWTGGVLNGIFTINNGVDHPQYWAGPTANKLRTLPGWGANDKAAVVRPFKNALIALDITKSGTRFSTMVKTSSFAVPGAVPLSWDHTDPTKEATEFDLGTAPLVDCMALGDANIIYTEKDMWAQTLGGALIWSYRKLDDVGALTRGCIAAIPGAHVVLTPGDVIVHSGQGAKSIIDGRNRRWMQNNIDSTNYKRSFVVSNPARAEVWVCFPTSGALVPNAALIWNWVEDTWTLRDLNDVSYAAIGRISPSTAATWDTVTGTWADAALAWNSDPFSPAATRLVTCSTAPRISLMDSGNTFNGTTFSSTLERSGDVQGDASRDKTLKCIYPRIDGPTTATLTIEGGGAMDVEQGPTYPFVNTYTIGSTYKADGFAFGRALAYRFTSIGNQFFRIKSFDIEYYQGGLF